MKECSQLFVFSTPIKRLLHICIIEGFRAARASGKCERVTSLAICFCENTHMSETLLETPCVKSGIPPYRGTGVKYE